MIWWGNRTKNVRTLKYQSGDTLNDVKQVVKDGKSIWAKYMGEISIELDEHVKYIEVKRQSSNEPAASEIDISGDPSEYEPFSVYYGDEIRIHAETESGYLFYDNDNSTFDWTFTVVDSEPDIDLTTYKEPEELIKPTISITQKSNGQLELKLQYSKSSSYSELHYYTLDVYAERYWDYFAQDDSQRGDEEELIEDFEENYSIENPLYNETVKPREWKTTTRTYTFGNDIWHPEQTTWSYIITLSAAGDDAGKYKDYRVDGNVHS